MLVSSPFFGLFLSPFVLFSFARLYIVSRYKGMNTRKLIAFLLLLLFSCPLLPEYVLLPFAPLPLCRVRWLCRNPTVPAPNAGAISDLSHAGRCRYA